MSIALDRTLLTDRFADEWEATYPAVPWLAENMPSQTISGQPFVRLMVEPNETFYRGMGEAAQVRRFGRVVVQVCVPEATGTALLDELVGKVESIFYRWTSEDHTLRCLQCNITRRAPVQASSTKPGDPYHVVVLSTAYESTR